SGQGNAGGCADAAVEIIATAAKPAASRYRMPIVRQPPWMERTWCPMRAPSTRRRGAAAACGRYRVLPPTPSGIDLATDPRRAQQHATRAAFFIPGFVIATWAPLVPFAKLRAGLDEAGLGLVLLCLGMGSLLA